MIAQHYKIPANDVMMEQARPGQFVQRDASDTTIQGFVDFVSDDKYMAVMLFKPGLLPENAIVIADTCDWETRLREIIANDPIVAKLWKEN